MKIFEFQYQTVPIYNAYCQAIGTTTNQVKCRADIPFLPIHFFKTRLVYSTKCPEPQLRFQSSGTTSEAQAIHQIAFPELYHFTLKQNFESRFGALTNYNIVALLPSYLERKNSSLVYMVEQWTKINGQNFSPFYLDDFTALKNKLEALKTRDKKILLIGVTFALIDFAEKFPLSMEGVTIFETGGMKGRSQEWTRSQVHDFLKTKWNVNQIFSEYGMTELLSQSYTDGE